MNMNVIVATWSNANVLEARIYDSIEDLDFIKKIQLNREHKLKYQVFVADGFTITCPVCDGMRGYFVEADRLAPCSMCSGAGFIEVQTTAS